MASNSTNSKKLQEKFRQLRSNALKRGVSDKQLRDSLPRKSSGTSSTKPANKTWKQFQRLKNQVCQVHVIVAVMAVVVSFVSMTTFYLYYEDIVTTPCLMDTNLFLEEIYRPIVNCNMCADVHNIPEERNLSAEDFYKKYAFSGRPVLVKEATANWTAMSHFSFHYFKKLYKETKGAMRTIEEDCQFFPYETEFLSLAEALNMPDERATFQSGQLPWYIGWSNCHEGVSRKLRRHYERPYFLPDDSETVAEDWIFMGGSGRGAGTHLDYVERPSWQAQISGTKSWELIPSPECEAVCHALNVTVHKGDIIVLDTNIWYHSTFVHPGEISITIGSEFD